MVRFNLLDDDYVTVSIIAPAVQWLLVAKVRGIYRNSIWFGLTCWMMTYVTVFFLIKRVDFANGFC